MKKFFTALMVAVFIMASCSMSDKKPEAPRLPAHVQYIEDESNRGMKEQGIDSSIKIIRYEDDGHTLWLWTDHSEGPDDCDYVLVLGIVDRDTANYKVLTIFSNKQIPNACEYASAQYKKYLELMGQMEEESKLDTTPKNRRNDTI